MKFMAGNALGPLIYIAFYAARPLVLFPASLLTVVAGFVFVRSWASSPRS